MAIFEDTFTDTAGVALTSHTPAPGPGTWGGSANPVITNANRARTNTGSAGVSCIESEAPAHSQYDVEADIVVFTMPTGSLFGGIMAFADTNLDTESRRGYHLLLGNNVLTLKSESGGPSDESLGSVSGATWNTGGGGTAVYHFKLTARLSGASTVLNVYVTRSDGQYLKSDGTYQVAEVACIAATPSTGHQPGGANGIPAIGKGGVVWFQTGPGDAAGIHIDNFAVTQFFPALAAGAITFTSATPTQVDLSSAVATGGTSPYSYQWQRATSANGSYSDLSGETSTTLSDDTLTPGTKYWYRMKVTDSAGSPATAYSAGIPGNTWGSVVVLGIIGDSISTGTGATDPAPIAVARLKKLTTQRQVTLGSNQAVSGSSTATWRSTYLAGAITAFNSAGVTHVSIMLGTNGTYATYEADLADICAQLIAEGMAVFLHCPPFGDGLGDAANETLYNMQAIIDGLVNGTTILQGDRLAYEYFGQHISELSGAHPTATGDESLGTMWANAMDASLNGSAVVASGGVTRSRLPGGLSGVG